MCKRWSEVLFSPKDYHVVNIRHAWIFLLPLFPSQFSRCLLHMIGCSSQAPPTPENLSQPSSREMWHHAPSTPTGEQNTVTPQFTSRGQQVQRGASGSVWSTEDNDCPALKTCSVFIINESVLRRSFKWCYVNSAPPGGAMENIKLVNK